MRRIFVRLMQGALLTSLAGAVTLIAQQPGAPVTYQDILGGLKPDGARG